MSTILVIGSTGKVGRVVTEELLRAGESVRVATRNPLLYAKSEAVTPVLFDYTHPDTFQSALAGVDSVFMMEPQPQIHPEPHHFMIPLVEAAASSARKIVMMSSASVAFDDDESLRKVERAIECSSAPYVILRPNWFMDNFHTWWCEPIRDAGVLPLPAADARTAFVDSRDVGAAAAAALGDATLDSHTFTLSGAEALSYHAAASLISAACEREIQYIPIDDETFAQSMLEAGVPGSQVDYVTRLFRFTREGKTAEVTNAVEQLTGRPPRRLSDYVRDHAPAWRR